MEILRIALPSMVLALLVGGQAALADGWSLARLNPFAGKRTAEVSPSGYGFPYSEPSGPRKEPSPLQKLNTGSKKFFADTGAKTKKFFADTGDALGWKRPAPKKRPRRSWMDSLLGREEPKPVESFDDWWALKRMDP